jgi:hypothetical protein
MRKRRYEMLLPLVHNDGRPVAPEKFQQTVEELVARFGAVSQLPATVRGIWTHEGRRFEAWPARRRGAAAARRTARRSAVYPSPA